MRGGGRRSKCNASLGYMVSFRPAWDTRDKIKPQRGGGGGGVETIGRRES